MSCVDIRGAEVGPGRPLYLIAGPCVLEDPDEMLRVAEHLADVARRLDLPLCFKSSFRKDNRTSATSPRGPGRDEGLSLLARIGQATGLPLLTDVHLPEDCAPAAQVVDVLQIPAFLCRQTSLLEAAGATDAAVNVKKGQFLSPVDMKHVLGKLRDAGCTRALATERGSSFGYGDLVVDFRAHHVMHSFDVPVVFDATHAVQSPGSGSGVTGGRPELIPLLMRCGLAAGCDALFLETHPEPARAWSDAGSQLPLERFEGLALQAKRWRELYLETMS
ncbi:MAG TPA: 3-deoxy-8-phosphooctulonate synthase [Candidatus Krumholzibacteria bacterium]|nr:3-deoxy-8-phosphooctulonate synthase [Candidatus Krumholzibacteria bacterium]HRX50381.1 3-deoxy-8-phosphooctulonate synthase [Candidatus Krumholzibacteria bacterium]